MLLVIALAIARSCPPQNRDAPPEAAIATGNRASEAFFRKPVLDLSSVGLPQLRARRLR
jgi:hypothetical protein